MATDEGKEGHDMADFATEHKEDHRHETQELNTHSVALAAALAEQKPNPWSRNMMKLYVIMGLGYLISTMNGYDSSLMGSINAMIPYQETFGLDGAGSSTGMVFIIYNLGQIAAFPFCGLLADGYGRRWCIFAGCLVVVIGTAVQATANSLGHFIGGRFILGFGASIASAAGPAYTVELAHPAYRGFMAGMYNVLWWLGNIIAGWATYGSNLHFTSSWAWRVPTIVQAGMPGVAMLVILFFPESPRWLISQDRTEEALQVMAKYHGDGDVNHPVVQLQYREIVEQHNMYRTENPWWDYRELVNTRAARYRLAMVIGMSFFGQWSGNNVVSFTANTDKHPNLAYGVIVAIYIFGIFFAWGFTPLQTLYAVECLENRTRAKGSGLNFLFLNIAMVVNTWGISEGIRKLGWKLYVIYIVWIGIEMVIIYFWFVETAGKTLEELSEVFEAPNPRKESTKKHKVEVDASGRVVHTKDTQV
ncbi:lactose permease [Ilyonectria robusta]